MRAILTLLLFLALVGCAPTRVVEVPHVVTLRDTLRQTATRVDSVYVRDSIYADGATVYKERAVVKVKVERDTTYVTRTDTVAVPRYIERAKPLPMRDQACLYIGRLAIAAALLWGIAAYLRRRR